MSYTVLVAGNPADHALGQFCASGFEALGHNVEYVDITTGTVPLVHVEYGTSAMEQRFLDSVHEHDPDIVFVVKGSSVSHDLLSRVRVASNAIICNWNPDNPFMTRSEPRRMDTYLRALPEYDLTFIWSRDLFEDLRSEGAQEVRYLPFSYNTTLHQPATPEPKHDADVVFVGHWSDKRQRHLTTLLDLDVDLAIYGNYWKRKCFNLRLRRCVRNAGVFGQEYVRALSGGDIAINVVADHNLEAWNMKSFEIPAIGTTMITSHTERQESLYGEEGAGYFESPAELREVAREFLSDDARCERTAETAAELVQPHTYRARMGEVINAVESL